MASIYDFKLKNISGKIVDFSNFKNKLILIVNVASKCWFTKQYKDLEKLYNKYKEKEFVILGFPCMQFKQQEFNTDIAIKEFCTLKYNVTFEIFSRIDVKGENQSLLYKFLTKEFPWNENSIDVKWNFEKFLIDRKGKVIRRFSSIVTPKKIEKIIKKIL